MHARYEHFWLASSVRFQTYAAGHMVVSLRLFACWFQLCTTGLCCGPTGSDRVCRKCAGLVTQSMQKVCRLHTVGRLGQTRYAKSVLALCFGQAESGRARKVWTPLAGVLCMAPDICCKSHGC